MSQVYGASLIAGSQTFGSGGHGILGSVIRSTTATGPHGPGYLYNDWDDASDDPKEFRGLITAAPSAGAFFAYEDGSFTLTGAPDGSYTFTYQLYVDGIATGSPQTDSITVGGGGVLASSAITLAPFTQAAAGTVVGGIAGSGTAALGSVTQAALGAVAVAGSSSRTLEAFTQAASGIVGQPPVQGGSSLDLGAVTQVATGTVAGSIVVAIPPQSRWLRIKADDRTLNIRAS
jgi:hypothetical protein